MIFKDMFVDYYSYILKFVFLFLCLYYFSEFLYIYFIKRDVCI